MWFARRKIMENEHQNEFTLKNKSNIMMSSQKKHTLKY